MVKFDEEKYYSMPAMFGGLTVRQKILFESIRTVSVVCVSTRESLERYIPEGFRLDAPEIRYTFWQCQNVSWLREGRFSGLCAGVPVSYVGNDEGLSGLLPLVLWEDLFSVIVSSREEAGLPALYAESHVQEDVGCMTIALGREGLPFVSLTYQPEGALSTDEIAAINAAAPSRNFGWRYIPNTGAPGAALSHATVSPVASHISSGTSGKGSIVWHTDAPIQPGQGHILKALSALPVSAVSEAFCTLGSLHLMPELSRPLP